MRRRLPSLNAIRAFEATARHLSFKEAAAELNVTQGAVSRQVKALELYLGFPLFKRKTRAIELTEVGRTYWTAMHSAFDQIEIATQRAIHESKGGILTINALPSFAMRWLIPRLGAFNQAHPDIEVRMITSIQPVSFAREDIDVAIRVGRIDGKATRHALPRIDLVITEDWTGVVYEKLLPDNVVPVCSPALYEKIKPISSARDLLRAPLLHTASRPHAWSDWFAAQGVNELEPDHTKSYGHFFMTLQSAAEGRGVAMVPRILIQGELRSGSLVVPFDPAIRWSTPHYYLVGSKNRWDTPKVRQFRSWIGAAAKKEYPEGLT